MIDVEDIEEAVYEVLHSSFASKAEGDALAHFTQGVMMLGTNLLDRLGER